MHLSPKSTFTLCWQWEAAFTVAAGSIYTPNHALVQGQKAENFETDLCSLLPGGTPLPHQHLQSWEMAVKLFSKAITSD